MGETLRAGLLRTVLIDDADAIAEAVARLDDALGPAAELVAVTSFAAASTDDQTPPDIILFEPQAAGCGDLTELDRLRTRLPQARFAAFSCRNSAFDARRLLGAGVHGYILKTAEPPVLRAAIGLILAGEVYLPPCLLSEDADAVALGGGAGDGAAGERTASGRLRSAVFRRALHPDGRVTCDYIRPMFPDASGLCEESLRRRGADAFLAVMHPADRPIWRASLLASARDLSPHWVEYRLRDVNGRYGWFRSVARPSHGKNGTVVWDGYVTEIGPEGRSPATQSRADRLREILDRTFQFIGVLSPEGLVLEVNQTTLDFGGLRYADVVGKPFWEARLWSLSERYGAELRDAIRRAAGGAFVRYKVDVRSRDDQAVTIDFSVKPVSDEGGHITFLIAEGRDISSLPADQPAAEIEDRMRDSGRRLAAILANLPGMVFRGTVGADGNPRFLFVSRGVTDLTGVTPDDALADAAALLNLVHPDDLPGLMAAIHESHRTHQPLTRIFRITARSGELRWLRVVVQPWLTHGGEVVGDGVAIDITEQHEAEERLREQERSFAAIAANLPGVVFRGVAAPGDEPRFTYVSPNVTRFAGITPDEVLADPERLFATIHPDDRELHRRAVRERITNPAAPNHEFRVIRPDGAVRWLRSVATTWRRPNGELVIDGITLDVTDQREIEERLRERERVLEALTDNLPAIVLRCVHGADGSSRCAFVAGDLERLTGLSAEGVLDGSTPISSRVHPDDQAAYVAAYHRAAAELTELDHEYRLIKPEGEVRWLRWIGRPTPDPGGDVLVDGIMLDTTEHRRALEELDRRNRDLLALIRVSEIALKSPNLDAGFRAIVDEIGRFTGFDTVSIGLYDETRQTVDYRAFRRFDSKRFEGRWCLPISKVLAGEVIRTGQPVIERRCLGRTEPRFTRMHDIQHQTFFGVPIRVGRRVIGSFNLTARHDVEVDARLSELVASWADYVASFIASQGAEEVAALLGEEWTGDAAWEATFASLTPRQRDVLAELATGKPNREIAATLRLQEATVKVHVGAILKALGVDNRTQAANIANAVFAARRRSSER